MRRHAFTPFAHFAPAAPFLLVAGEAEHGWYDSAEAGTVATSGNTGSVTPGFKSRLRWVGERSDGELDLHERPPTRNGTRIDTVTMDPDELDGILTASLVENSQPPLTCHGRPAPPRGGSRPPFSGKHHGHE
jgi:hypothetical protein